MARLLLKKGTPQTTDVNIQKSNRVAVDFPREDSNISGPYYSIRVGALDAETVDISINQGEWIPCRHDSGYWWYDWANFKAGTYQLVARARIGGQTDVSKIRKFTAE